MPFEKFENDTDRKNQDEVAAVLKRHLESYEIVGMGLDGLSYWEFKPTPQSANLPHDYVIFHHGREVAVAEVKCREGRYTLDYMIKNGMLITTSRLNNLREQHHLNGRHVLIVTRTSDMHILYVNMMTLITNRGMLETKPEGCIKTDHGKKDKKGTGTIIPFSLLKEIGNGT